MARLSSQIDELWCACNNPPTNCHPSNHSPPPSPRATSPPTTSHYLSYPVYPSISFGTHLCPLYLCCPFYTSGCAIDDVGTVLFTFQVMADHVTHAVSIVHLRSSPQVQVRDEVSCEQLPRRFCQCLKEDKMKGATKSFARWWIGGGGGGGGGA